jgi:hypothetical protein
MSNFELIDDYLTNRLNEQDRKSFEQQMAVDPSLKAEVALQEEIIQGLKAARVAELKAMLSKVPAATPTLYFSPLRIAAGLIGTAVLATGLYFYFEKNNGFNPTQLSSSLVDSIRRTEQPNAEIESDSISQDLNINSPQIEKVIDPAEGKKEVLNSKKNAEDYKPAIDLLDPTEELQKVEHAYSHIDGNKASISISKIEVTVKADERKFKSHYQFVNGKLTLYGDFDHDLYEIIEVNAQKSRSLFLYYKASYYVLDETRKEIMVLKEISDPVLIQKLKTFRSN